MFLESLLPLVNLFPIALVMGVIVFMAFRRNDRKRPHRSFFQLIVFALYFIARWQYALIKGIDQGYVQYRLALQQTELEIDNERELGLILRKSS